ncbi:MAG: site-specific integrase [Pseudobdellovibrio sp.]
MNNEKQKPAKKSRNKRPAIEPGIYPNLDKNGNPDGTFDVKVSRRMWMSDSNPHGQMFRRKRRVNGIVNAQRQKKKFMDELSMEALRHEGNDTTWEKARDEYYKYLSKRYKEGSVAYSTMDSTIKTLEKHTKRWDKKWLSEFTADFLETFLTDEKLKSEIESATRLTLLKYIRGVFKRQVATGRLKHNPAQGILVRVDKKRKYPTVMSHEEALSLINYAKTIHPDWANVYTVAYLTGARSGELYALKWEHVDFKNKIIYIKDSYDWKTEKTKSTKGKKDRTVPINSSLDALLKELKLKNPLAEYVLPRIADWRNGKSAQIIRQYQKALGIKQSKFHAIRGTFITNLLLAGVPVIKVQAICGHDDLKTTLLYVGMLGEDTKGATESLSLEPKVVSLDEFKDKKKIP